MDSSWSQLILVCILLSKLASSEVKISTVKPLRLGDTFRVFCNATSKVSSCTWDVNGRQDATGQVRPISVATEMECGVEAKATEDLNGIFTCKVFTESSSEIPESAHTTVSVIAVPSVSLRPAIDIFPVIVKEEQTVICVVNDARPVPSVVWQIGDHEVDPKDYSTSSHVGANGKVAMNSILKRQFEIEENRKILQCIVKADWLRNENNAVAQTTLDIQFPPIPQNNITIYGFEDNEPGVVRITLQANPRPHRAFWILPTPSNDTLEVEGKDVGDLSASNYTGHIGEDNGNSTYMYQLNISSVQNRDANPGIKFQVFNMVGTREASQQYCIQAVTKSQLDLSDSQSILLWVIFAVGSVTFLLVFLLLCFRILRNKMRILYRIRELERLER